jgi:hypothetical protein
VGDFEVPAGVVRIATENTGCGYTRIMGALANLGVSLGPGTIQRIVNVYCKNT